MALIRRDEKAQKPYRYLGGTVMQAIPGILLKILSSLITEALVKRMAYILIKWAAKKSETDLDDQIVKEVGKAWGYGE